MEKRKVTKNVLMKVKLNVGDVSINISETKGISFTLKKLNKKHILKVSWEVIEESFEKMLKNKNGH